MDEKKVFHSGIGFLPQSNEKSLCEHCNRIINNLLLLPHSLIHRHEIKLQNRNYAQSVIYPIPDSDIILLETKEEPQIHCTSPSSNPIPSHRPSLVLAIKYSNSCKSYLKKLKNIHKRCLFLQKLSRYKKWKKIL